MSNIESLSKLALADIAAAATPDALEALRVGLLGKSGSITAQLKALGALPGDQRKAAGEAINRARDAISEALAARKTAPAAVVGGWSSDRAVELAAALNHADHPRQRFDSLRIHLRVIIEFHP